ncbi:hypothetical protein PsYK624_004750 [Phanerochaete sordida]|uniref:Uncharacterized protein n=1 Tax=Phanerochaete sordida TaxID=48140 RepID=A0A9P3L7E1_9APHY|nr:hypothetical protein PsYK624_004750 [Phanerochaete sordida]
MGGPHVAPPGISTSGRAARSEHDRSSTLVLPSRPCRPYPRPSALSQPCYATQNIPPHNNPRTSPVALPG